MKSGFKFFLALGAVLLVLRSAALRAAEAPIELPGIENAFRVNDRLFSGSQPEGDAAFAALARLGVKTLISVDGTKPDVERARKFGLRYVHLPFGYDGVPPERVAQLTQAGLTLAGPLFVHCHHGKHRGPAAVAIMCEAAGDWTPAQAEAWLQAAGTSPDYPGLYNAVRGFKPVPAGQLALPEVSQSAPLVDLMVEIDGRFDFLKEARAKGWKSPPAAARFFASDESTLLWEHFREISRSEETSVRPQDYREKAAEAERASDALRTALHSTPPDFLGAEDAFKAVGESCAACHKAFRNKQR